MKSNEFMLKTPVYTVFPHKEREVIMRKLKLIVKRDNKYYAAKLEETHCKNHGFLDKALFCSDDEFKQMSNPLFKEINLEEDFVQVKYRSSDVLIYPYTTMNFSISEILYCISYIMYDLIDAIYVTTSIDEDTDIQHLYIKMYRNKTKVLNEHWDKKVIENVLAREDLNVFFVHGVDKFDLKACIWDINFNAAMETKIEEVVNALWFKDNDGFKEKASKLYTAKDTKTKKTLKAYVPINGQISIYDIFNQIDKKTFLLSKTIIITSPYSRSDNGKHKYINEYKDGYYVYEIKVETLE